LDPPLSRGLWLVKWLLLIPHVFVLAILWFVLWPVTVIAFVAILVTGRYPRPLFDYTAGVLRWSWRVSYYGYSALGTDRYPPFALRDIPDYPARLEIPYPRRLSRGLALVKWWLLALPHYAVVAAFTGGSYTVYQTAANGGQEQAVLSYGVPGLLAALVLFAAVALLFTARYPAGLFAFVVGMDRWILRVAAYAFLLTDEYPPFRLDLGGDDPAPAVEDTRPEAVDERP
jgi:hypothetical protein